MSLSPPPSAPPSEPTHRSRWALRLRHTGPGNAFAALLMIGVPFIAANVLTRLFLDAPELRDLRNLIKVIVLLASYWAFVRWWERRPVRELSLNASLQEVLAGLWLGGLLFTAVVGVLAVLGAYSLDAVGTPSQLRVAVADTLPKAWAGALIEELIFRLLLLRLLERSVGTAWALVVSSLAFGLAHTGNAGASFVVGLMLGAELGLLFGAAYLLTRRLWLCAAMHLAWNFVQGAVFSIAVSGQLGEGWLRGSLSGPAWLTGGAFGAEASVVSLLLCLAATGLLLVAARARGAAIA